MTLDEQILKIKQQVDEIKTKKIQITTHLKTLEEEKDELLKECQLLNIDPQKIDSTIKQYEEIINKELSEIEHELRNFYVN